VQGTVSLIPVEKTYVCDVLKLFAVPKLNFLDFLCHCKIRIWLHNSQSKGVKIAEPGRVLVIKKNNVDAILKKNISGKHFLKSSVEN
jgi:hypothetical protein